MGEPFSPFLRHAVVNERCTRCGLVVPIEAVVGEGVAYSHSGFFCTEPMAEIVDCR